jgi:hypothetical protein
MRRLLLPTEEFPIKSSLQLTIEFVAAIGEGEGMVVSIRADTLGSSPIWVRGGHVSIRLMSRDPPALHSCMWDSVLASSSTTQALSGTTLSLTGGLPLCRNPVLRPSSVR